MNSLREASFDDVIEVRRVLRDHEANELLADGCWRLLHVSGRQWTERIEQADGRFLHNTRKDAMYVLGRVAEDAPFE